VLKQDTVEEQRVQTVEHPSSCLLLERGPLEYERPQRNNGGQGHRKLALELDRFGERHRDEHR